MARKSPPCATIVAAVIVGFGLFIVAIIARNFWLSLTLGIAAAIALAYAVLLLRQYRNRLPNVEKSAS